MTSEEPTKEEAAPAVPKTEKKEEAGTEVNEALLKNVAERLKFFFSNANIRQDFFVRKFLIASNGDDRGGAIPVDVLLKFNTIKTLTLDPDVLAKAVTTHLSDVLEVRGGGGSIARVKPFTEAMLSDNVPLSLYVKNLPTKDNNYNQKQYDVRMDDIRKMFEQYGEVALVKLRFRKSANSDDADHTDDIKTEPAGEDGAAPAKKPNRRFPLGACLVEFESLESLEKAAADVLTLKGGEKVEAKRKLEVGGNTLEVMTLKDYVGGLKKDRKRDRNDSKEGDDEGKTEGDGTANDFTIDWKPGCVISLKGLPEDCDREAILNATMTACNLTHDELKEKKIYADYSRGQKDGALRFPEPELAKMMVDKLKSDEEKLEIAGAKLEDAILLEGDAEKKYWDEFIEFKKKQMRHRAEERKHKGGRNNKRRRGGGGRDRW